MLNIVFTVQSLFKQLSQSNYPLTSDRNSHHLLSFTTSSCNVPESCFGVTSPIKNWLESKKQGKYSVRGTDIIEGLLWLM